MTTQNQKIRYGAVFQPAPRLPDFRGKTLCDLCELWVARCSERWRVNCVNFERRSPREKRPVNCVNFEMSKATSRFPFVAFFKGGQARA
jgi:hypothetical protein